MTKLYYSVSKFQEKRKQIKNAKNLKSSYYIFPISPSPEGYYKKSYEKVICTKITYLLNFFIRFQIKHSLNFKHKNTKCRSPHILAVKKVLNISYI